MEMGRRDDGTMERWEEGTMRIWFIEQTLQFVSKPQYHRWIPSLTTLLTLSDEIRYVGETWCSGVFPEKTGQGVADSVFVSREE